MKRILLLTVALCALLVPAASAQQRTIALPDNFTAEGIASGRGDTFFAGSIESAEVYRGSYRTGDGSVLVSSRPGRNHVGLKFARRSNLLFVAGGMSKGIYVYDARTGADVRQYLFPTAGFINDVVVTKRAVYATDSQMQQFYKIALDREGQPGEATTIPITGEFAYGPGFNANGIEAVKRGKRLVMVQSSTGKLFTVSSRSGDSREIRLNRPVRNGDGILLRGRTLFVVRNRDNKIAVVKLRRKLRSGKVVRQIRNRSFDVPTTIAPFRRFLYAVNGRFPPEGNNRNPREDVVRVSAGGKKDRGRDDRGKSKRRKRGDD